MYSAERPGAPRLRRSYSGGETLMMTVLLIAATAAAGSAKAAEVSGGMSLISSELITAIFTGMAAVLGVIWQRGRNKDALREKDDEIRRIKAELPQPLSVEQSSYQATMKENARDHENLFGRIAVAEQAISRVEAKLDTGIAAINEQLKNQGAMLFERICKGVKKS